jgi:DUF971 family protein
MTPLEIHLHQRSAILELQYEDGTIFNLAAEYLRVSSPSAEVLGHGPGQEVLQHGKKDVRIMALEPQGHYAVKIVFSDGHNSGLYSWDYLYELGTTYPDRWAAYLKRLEQAGKKRESPFIAISR